MKLPERSVRLAELNVKQSKSSVITEAGDIVRI